MPIATFLICQLLSQGFVTDHERALGELFGESAQNSRRAEASLNVMASRISTVFASLKVIWTSPMLFHLNFVNKPKDYWYKPCISLCCNYSIKKQMLKRLVQLWFSLGKSKVFWWCERHWIFTNVFDFYLGLFQLLFPVTNLVLLKLSLHPGISFCAL